MWRTLMTETLGFPRYFAQGGDWGAIITALLALRYPEKLAAFHLNMVALTPSISVSRVTIRNIP